MKSCKVTLIFICHVPISFWCKPCLYLAPHSFPVLECPSYCYRIHLPEVKETIISLSCSKASSDPPLFTELISVWKTNIQICSSCNLRISFNYFLPYCQAQSYPNLYTEHTLNISASKVAHCVPFTWTGCHPLTLTVDQSQPSRSSKPHLRSFFLEEPSDASPLLTHKEFYTFLIAFVILCARMWLFAHLSSLSASYFITDVSRQ